MLLVALLFTATLFLAYSNGANDNLKGVATLYGSNTASFNRALTVATIATLAGAISSVFLAAELVKAFSGKGLVPDIIASTPSFLLAVAIGASATVMLATVVGLPISTTHSLIGGLAGAGFAAAGSDVNLGQLGGVFLLPLLLSPLIAVLLTMPFYKIAHTVTSTLGIEKESCICVGPSQFVPVPQLSGDATAYAQAEAPGGVSLTIADQKDCVDKYNGHFLGVSTQCVVDSAHYLSACAVSFARGLNDTPKIVGLLLVVKALDIRHSMVAIALAMAIGGLLQARRVAHTMSKKISNMNDGQALMANLVTAGLVIFASKFGLPVSTTHVSVGSITGIGIVNGSANKSVVGSILTSWLLTLPIAAAIAAVTYVLLNAIA
ncbi:MAG: inorganic phosphate transporter [Hyphomicrobium sp.]